MTGATLLTGHSPQHTHMEIIKTAVEELTTATANIAELEAKAKAARAARRAEN